MPTHDRISLMNITPTPLDVQQEKQSFNQPMSWRFPDPPAEEEPHFPPDFELKTPEAADSVSAVCGVDSVRVEAKKDLLGIGKPVLPADVALGGCPATGEDPDTQVLVFESELHGCGSQLLVRAVFTPAKSITGFVRVQIYTSCKIKLF